MGLSAFEIVIIPVLRGMIYGILAGMAILAVMNAVEALVDRLDRRSRLIKAVHRATVVAPRRTHRPTVRTGRARSVYG
jgi:riboflavin transporter FmnP